MNLPELQTVCFGTEERRISMMICGLILQNDRKQQIYLSFPARNVGKLIWYEIIFWKNVIGCVKKEKRNPPARLPDCKAGMGGSVQICSRKKKFTALWLFDRKDFQCL